jgi:hypothetical protein
VRARKDAEADAVDVLFDAALTIISGVWRRPV